VRPRVRAARRARGRPSPSHRRLPSGGFDNGQAAGQRKSRRRLRIHAGGHALWTGDVPTSDFHAFVRPGHSGGDPIRWTVDPSGFVLPSSSSSENKMIDVGRIVFATCQDQSSERPHDGIRRFTGSCCHAAPSAFGGVAYVVPWRGSGGTGHMGLTADADGGFRVIWADRRTGI
jgi:hypothetical protein